VALLRCQQVWIPDVENIEKLVHRVWRLEALETRYQDFNQSIEALLAMLDRLKQGGSADPELLFFDAMGLQGELLEIIMYEDPCLPIELLPSDWPGQRTHELVHILSNVIAGLEVASDESYHYLFHALRGMEVLEVFRPEGDETFHWPGEGEGR
jgi:DNA-binding transcriptional regulator PaaX